MGISIIRALTEKKTLTERINKAIVYEPTYGFVVGDAKKPSTANYKTEEEMRTKILAGNQRINALMDRYNSVTSAIIMSNATTEVEIGGVKMTVAEAIERKKSIEFKKALLNEIRADLAKMNNEMATNENEIRRAVDSLSTEAMAAHAETDTVKVITKSLNAERKFQAVDPLDLQKLYETLRDEIDTFDAEVDFVLAESNSITMIEV